MTMKTLPSKSNWLNLFAPTFSAFSYGTCGYVASCSELKLRCWKDHANGCRRSVE